MHFGMAQQPARFLLPPVPPLLKEIVTYKYLRGYQSINLLFTY